MAGTIAYKFKKTKANASVKNLLKEMYRTEDDKEKYDDGIRDLHPEKTKDNVWLEKPNIETFDKERKEKIKTINQKRAERTGEEYTAYDRRSLRSDTVDLLSQVIQPSKEWLAVHTDDEAEELLTDVYYMMKEHPELYGEIKAYVIHRDESSIHAQSLSSTLDEQELRSKAKELTGNKKAMSEKQTIFAKGLQDRGWDVERGVNRVDYNYQNWKKQMEEKYDTKMTRHNEKLFIQAEQFEQQDKQYRDMMTTFGQNVGKVNNDGIAIFKMNDEKIKKPVQDLTSDELIGLYSSIYEYQQNDHEADIDYFNQEFQDLSNQKEKYEQELSQVKLKVREKESEHRTWQNIVQDEKDKYETFKAKLDEDKLNYKTQIETEKQQLRRENEQLRQENQQLKIQNQNEKSFMDKVIENKNGEYTDYQDEMIVNYTRFKVYKDDPKGLSDVIKSGANMMKSAQRKSNHMQGAPKSRVKSHSKEVEREL